MKWQSDESKHHTVSKDQLKRKEKILSDEFNTKAKKEAEQMLWSDLLKGRLTQVCFSLFERGWKHALTAHIYAGQKQEREAIERLAHLSSVPWDAVSSGSPKKGKEDCWNWQNRSK